MFNESALPGSNKKSYLNVVLGVVMILSALTAAGLFYIRELKPRLTAEQMQVNKSYTFTLLCDVQQPITGIFLEWLIGRDGANAWTYNIACVVDSEEDIEIISNGVQNLLPQPRPGLHFLVVADSAPVSIIDWEREFREKGYNLNDPNVNLPNKLTSYSFSHPGMRLYMLYLKPLEDGTKVKVLCREAIDKRSDNPRDWRPFYLCSSN